MPLSPAVIACPSIKLPRRRTIATPNKSGRIFIVFLTIFPDYLSAEGGLSTNPLYSPGPRLDNCALAAGVIRLTPRRAPNHGRKLLYRRRYKPVITMKANAVVIPIVPDVAVKRILYATDFSQASLAALPLVAAVARKYGSQVFVVNVWTPAPYTMVSPETAGVMQHKDEREAQTRVRQLLKTKALAGLSASAMVKAGIPEQELSQLVRQKNIDLAILGTHGRTGFKHLVMGSVAEELFRHLPCPVLTVGPKVDKGSLETSEIKHILFPTDLSDESRAVFPYLASLASEYQASLTLLHVLPIENATNPEAGSLAEPLRKEMQSLFSSQIDPRCPAEFIIDFGDTTERILAHAETGRADLIGLGVRRAAEITTHVRNTVAYRVVLQAHCPVLTARQ